MSSPSHIAIVGCGFAGTSALFQLVDRYPVRRITVFEASGDYGPGFPYRADECPDYLLNNTNDTLCVVPSNRRAFLDWLKTQPDLGAAVEDKGHSPRTVFGAFLTDVVAAARMTAAVKGVEIEFVPEEVTGLRERAAHVVLSAKGREVEADAAILTTGRCPEIDHYPRPPKDSSARYVASHIRTTALDAISRDATVHVLGASLSAYDVINRLFAPSTGCRFERIADRLDFVAGPNERRVVLCSRSGRLKSAQSRQPAPQKRRRFSAEALRRAAATRRLTLDDIAEAIRLDAVDSGAPVNWESVRDPYAGCASAEDVNLQAGRLLESAIAEATALGAENYLVDLFADAQMEIWDVFAERILTPDAEQAYRKRYESAVLSYVAPCPISTAEKLAALHRAGRLSVVKGVRDVSFDQQSDCYLIEHEFGAEQARTLVNTTGSVDRDVDSARQPALIKDMVSQGLLSADRRDGAKMYGAAVDMKTMRALGARHVYLANMLLWGPGFFTSSAFMMATIVERALAAMFERADDQESA